MSVFSKHLPYVKAGSLGIFCLLLVTIVYLSFQYRETNYQIAKKQAEEQSGIETKKQSVTINPPVNIYSPYVTSVQLAYTFQGKIAEIVQEDSKTKITLQNNDESIPRFTVTERTQILRQEVKGDTPASVTDITVGTGVNVYANYDVRGSQWTVHRIYLPSSTSKPGSFPGTDRPL